jgi:hypothetical protein
MQQKCLYVQEALPDASTFNFEQHQTQFGDARAKPLSYRIELGERQVGEQKWVAFAYFVPYKNKSPTITFAETTSNTQDGRPEIREVKGYDIQQLEFYEPFALFKAKGDANLERLKALVKYYFLQGGYADWATMQGGSTKKFLDTLLSAMKKIDEKEKAGRRENPIPLGHASNQTPGEPLESRPSV